MNYDVIVVTSFFDIGRGNWPYFKRESEQYLEWFENLAQLTNQMVIFTERKFFSQILEIRAKYGLEHQTSVIVCEYPFNRDVWAINSAMSRPEFISFVHNQQCPEYWSSAYVIICTQKPTFVSTAIDILRLSDSDQVAWIDFGYCRDDKRFDKSVPWRFDCQGKMNLFYSRKPDDRPIFDIVRTGDVYFQGCHMVGPSHSWKELRGLIDDSLSSLLACGLVDDDQTALLMAYRHKSELFQIHANDPSDWFTVMRDFRIG